LPTAAQQVVLAYSKVSMTVIGATRSLGAGTAALNLRYAQPKNLAALAFLAALALFFEC
jgi:hypothetical protein